MLWFCRTNLFFLVISSPNLPKCFFIHLNMHMSHILEPLQIQQSLWRRQKMTRQSTERFCALGEDESRRDWVWRREALNWATLKSSPLSAVCVGRKWDQFERKWKPFFPLQCADTNHLVSSGSPRALPYSPNNQRDIKGHDWQQRHPRLLDTSQRALHWIHIEQIQVHIKIKHS